MHFNSYLLTWHQQGRYGRVFSGRWHWTRKPLHQPVCWSMTGSCDLVQVIYQAAQVVYPQTSFVLQDCFQVHSCIHIISWHNLLEAQQDPQVAHQKQQTALLQAASTWMLWWAHLKWKGWIEKSVFDLSLITNLEDVMLCWLDLFPLALVWTCGTCCCLHSLLSVGDRGNSLLS